MSTLTSQRWFFAAILLFGLLAMTARPATDPDLWWHLRTGQWIVETGHVPHIDPFSFTRGGTLWVSHEWLSEVVFYQIWRHAGLAALIIFSSAITTAGFLLLYLRCTVKPAWAAAATVLGAYASAPCWGTRPQMFTFALASLLLWLLEQAEHRPRLLFFVPPLFLLWVNLHAGFAVGPVLMFLYTAGVLLETATGTMAWQEARPIFTRVLVTILACMALVPVNPSGARLFLYPIDTVRFIELRALIVEWLSPDFHQPQYLPCLLLILLLFPALAWSRSQVKGRILLPVAFTLLSALDAVRHIPIFALVAIPVIVQALRPRPATQSPATIPARQRFRLFFNPAVIALLAVFVLWRWTSLGNTQEVRESADFPRQAIAFLRANALPGRLFAYYDWGGYAIWNLYPRYHVFADGRSDLYGNDILKQCQTALQLRDGWQNVLDQWSVQTVLIPPRSALAEALLLDSHWMVAYRDPQAALFVRASKLLPSQALLMALSSKPAKSEKMISRGTPNLRN